MFVNFKKSGKLVLMKHTLYLLIIQIQLKEY